MQPYTCASIYISLMIVRGYRYHLIALIRIRRTPPMPINFTRSNYQVSCMPISYDAVASGVGDGPLTYHTAKFPHYPGEIFTELLSFVRIVSGENCMSSSSIYWNLRPRRISPPNLSERSLPTLNTWHLRQEHFRILIGPVWATHAVTIARLLYFE